MMNATARLDRALVHYNRATERLDIARAKGRSDVNAMLKVREEWAEEARTYGATDAHLEAVSPCAASRRGDD